MSRCGLHTGAMLLGTIIGKITSFYKNATASHFEKGGTTEDAAPCLDRLGVSLGQYRIHGKDGRWLELEILARELRNLEEVYNHFKEICTELLEVQEVGKAMIEYLGQSLGSALEVVNFRKDNIGCA